MTKQAERRRGREVWAIVSDLHCGSTMGLMSSTGIRLDDGQHVSPSKEQRKLWSAWVDFWGRVAKTLREGDRLFVVVNGDLTEGNHHKTFQIISKNLAATQHQIALDCLALPLALEPAGLFVVRGTEAHVGSSAEWEERLAYDLGAIGDDSTGAASWWHLRVESQGCIMDFAHHGNVGRLPHTRLNPLGTLAMRIANAAAKRGEPIPHLAVRSHMHQWGDTGDNYRPRVIQLGCFQLSTSYVHRIAAGSLPEIGGIIVTCERSELSVEKVQFGWRRREPWRSGAKRVAK